jgi:hypothetical protein
MLVVHRHVLQVILPGKQSTLLAGIPNPTTQRKVQRPTTTAVGSICFTIAAYCCPSDTVMLYGTPPRSTSRCVFPTHPPH